MDFRAQLGAAASLGVLVGGIYVTAANPAVPPADVLSAVGEICDGDVLFVKRGYEEVEEGGSGGVDEDATPYAEDNEAEPPSKRSHGQVAVTTVEMTEDLPPVDQEGQSAECTPSPASVSSFAESSEGLSWNSLAGVELRGFNQPTNVPPPPYWAAVASQGSADPYWPFEEPNAERGRKVVDEFFRRSPFPTLEEFALDLFAKTTPTVLEKNNLKSLAHDGSNGNAATPDRPHNYGAGQASTGAEASGNAAPRPLPHLASPLPLSSARSRNTSLRIGDDLSKGHGSCNRDAIPAASTAISEVEHATTRLLVSLRRLVASTFDVQGAVNGGQSQALT